MGRQTAFWPDRGAGGEEKETKVKPAMAAMGQLSSVA